MAGSDDDFLENWHRIVADRDMDSLREILVDDVSIGAPPYWNRLEGRDLVHFLLTQILQTIEGFTYHREWRDGRELALEFKGQVGGLDLQGVDLITLDGAGRVAKLDVVIRPVNAVTALIEVVAPRMQAFLARRSPEAD